MHHILVTGAGKIGALIAAMLADSNDYHVYLADINFDGADVKRLLKSNNINIEQITLDVSDQNAADQFIKKQPVSAVISCLPYYLNEHVAHFAKRHDLHYFDLTEDINVTQTVKQLAENAKSAFVPQCGIAPGFISIVANSLMKRFETVDIVKMRVGALPQHTSNALHYALTWSTDGVINEYGTPCFGIENKSKVVLHPLEGLEHIQIDGLSYEAFNTSGGLGSLAELSEGKVNSMTYKTMRYPGHCEKMRILMNDLKLNQDRETLKRILENAIPKTYQDVVIVYVSVSGYRNGVYLEENYLNKVYPCKIAGQFSSAIQVTTASGICGVVDLVMTNPDDYQGLVYQEQFSLEQFLKNRFAQYFI